MMMQAVGIELLLTVESLYPRPLLVFPRLLAFSSTSFMPGHRRMILRAKTYDWSA